MSPLEQKDLFQGKQDTLEDADRTEEQEQARQEIEEIVGGLKKIEDFFSGCNEEGYKGDTILKGCLSEKAFEYHAEDYKNPAQEMNGNLNILFSYTYRSLFQAKFTGLERDYLKWNEASLDISHNEYIKLFKHGYELGIRGGYTGEVIEDRSPTPQEILKQYQDSYVRIILLAIENDLEEFTKPLEPRFLTGKQEMDGVATRGVYGLSTIFSYADRYLGEEFEGRIPRIKSMLWERMVKKNLIEGLKYRKDLQEGENIFPPKLFDLLNEDDRELAYSYIEHIVTAPNEEE